MINALRAETRRLVSRRMVLVTLLAMLAFVLLYQLQVSSEVAPPTAAEIAESQRDYDEYLADWEAHHEEWEAECTESGGTAEECSEPRPSLADWDLAPYAFDESVSSAIGLTTYLGGLVLFVAMASFVGAEASSGSLANWLTFVPRRSTVMASKLLVVAGFSVVVGAATGLLTVAASALVTTLHGQPLTGLGAMTAMAARAVLVVAVFGLAGFTVGLLTGSTGVSIGILLGGIFLTYAMSILTYVSPWARWLPQANPGVNLTAILDGGTTYEVSVVSGSAYDDDGAYLTRTLSMAHGLGYWAILLVSLLLVTWVVFRRRDVA